MSKYQKKKHLLLLHAAGTLKESDFTQKKRNKTLIRRTFVKNTSF